MIYWETITFSLIKNFVKLFNTFTIADTSFLISFDNIVFIYDIIRKKWSEQIYMDDQIVKFFRSEKETENKIE